MFLSKLFSRDTAHLDAAHALYAAAVGRAREPVFYRDLGVPDTLDGRFEMICLHVFLLLHRLKARGEEEARLRPLAQALFDLMFADMDRSLREMGAGDLGVGRRVKTMAEAFYGRVAAYEAGLARDEAGLARALARNVLGHGGDGTGEDAGPEADALAHYVTESIATLAALPPAMLMQGRAVFAPPPMPLEEKTATP